MSRQLEIAMAIRKAYQDGGYAAVQLLLDFEVSKHVVRKQARKLGVRSTFSGPPREVKPTGFQPDPLNQVFRSWGGMVEPGSLRWCV